MQLRDYQQAAVWAIHREFERVNSTLLVLATGLGKTHIGCHVAMDFDMGRVLWIAHRQELISQAAKNLRIVTGEHPAIELADQWSNETEWGRQQFVVASKDSLHPKRLERFKGIGLLVGDEAHHFSKSNLSYSRIVDCLREKNPNLKMLGLTATPKRHDKKALGGTFDSVAYQMEIHDALPLGWLVKPGCMTIRIDSMDLSNVGTVAGELKIGQLSDELERDDNVEGIADAAWRETQHRNCVLCFTASVRQAERLSEELNRRQSGCSEWLSAKSDPQHRLSAVQAFSEGRIKYMVQVGLFLEGFDEPRIDAIVMARPTKSLGLFTQVLGRCTRSLPGVIDGLLTPEDRLIAIRSSMKPDALVIDFTDNSNRHKLVHTTDVLGGKYEADIQDRIKEKVEERAKQGMASDVDELAKEAMDDVKREERQRQEEAQRARDEARRQRELKIAQYQKQQVDLFNSWERQAGEARKNNRIPSMLFGKYKGTLISEIDTGYLQWVLRECRVQSWFRAALKEEVAWRGAKPQEFGPKPKVAKPQPVQRPVEQRPYEPVAAMQKKVQAAMRWDDVPF